MQNFRDSACQVILNYEYLVILVFLSCNPPLHRSSLEWIFLAKFTASQTVTAPTVLQSSSKYTITAGGSAGSVNAPISIGVTISTDKAIQPSNWSIVQSMLQTQSANALILDPSINSADISTFTGFSGTNKWNDGILAPNGKIYAIPRDATSILIIDPKSAGTWDMSV